MDTPQSLLRSAKQFFAGTLLSRLSGLFRDITMSFCFGVAPEIAAFMVAYRLANLLRRLFGEGNLQSGFAPHFETLKTEGLGRAFLFYRDSAFSLFAALSAIVFAIEVCIWSLLGEMNSDWRQVAKLTMLMAPSLPFICLSSLNSAFLQCQKKYFTSALAPSLFNAVWILFAFSSQSLPLSQAVETLSIGITLSFAAQWGLTAVEVRKELKEHLEWKEWLKPQFFSSDWRKMIGPMGFGMLGIGAMQINSALDAIFARIADLSGPTFLWYAIRVQQLPLALFGIAISGALLPPLSRAMQQGDLDRYSALLSSALRHASALMVPCAFGLFTLGASGLNLLYGRGHFSHSDLRETLVCLWAYGIGLVPASFVLLLAAGSYAKKSYRFPTAASLLSVFCNLFLNWIFVFALDLGAVSIALSTSASALLNCALLLRNESIEPGFWRYVAKVTLAAVGASILSLAGGHWLGEGTFSLFKGEPILFSRNPHDQIVEFAAMGCIYLITFLAIAKTLRLHEIFMLLQRSRK